MDQLSQAGGTPFAAEVLARPAAGKLVVVDVGAAYGLAPALALPGDWVTGFGFDPDDTEVARLNASCPYSSFQYVAGFVGAPTPVEPHTTRNPWARLGVRRWLDLHQAAQEGATAPPPRLPPLQPAEGDAPRVVNLPLRPGHIDLPTFLRDHGVTRIDFLKIDVDGPDMTILQELEAVRDEIDILSIGIEVNFFGSPRPTDNSFHNIDRILKGWGLELFDLTTRRYPMAQLPVPSQRVAYPAASPIGRLYQGDAFYALDVCAPHHAARREELSEAQLLRLAVLHSLFGLPDCAAEILVGFADRLGGSIDLAKALDLLAAQAQPGVAEPLSYEAYIRAFEAQHFPGIG